MTAGFTGGLTFSRGDGASPEVFTAVEELGSLSNVGQTNPLIDMTSHDSTAREYIAGLPDGQEITVECKRVHTASNVQSSLVTDVINKVTRNFRVALVDSRSSPNLTVTYDFAAVCLSWSVAPSFDEGNMISFTLKISGAITIS